MSSNVLDQLERDHRTLNAELADLEAAARQASWPSFRRTATALSHELRRHANLERETVAASAASMGRLAADEWDAVAVEHGPQRRRLWVIEAFCRAPSLPEDQVLAAAVDMAAALRHAIARQEAGLLPMLRCWQAARRPIAETLDESLDGCVTIQEVLHRHPEAKTVFEEFLIPTQAHRLDPLDEVAWLYGVEVDDLLMRLQRTIVPATVSGSAVRWRAWTSLALRPRS